MRLPFSKPRQEQDEPAQPGDLPEDAVSVLDALVARAYAKRASDIHMEPKEKDVRVRYRIDGVMVEQTDIDGDLFQQVVSRVKVLARMDITERRTPQDGQLALDVGGSALHMRASTFPTVHGEKLVLRLFAGQGIIPFDDIGLAEHLRPRIRELAARPQGFMVTAGPTGAGKTSTLYALLALVDARRGNVVTLEDPVEVELPGITQAQINPRAGFTFASGLRAVLRQDPDVILVGEVRDAETAGIALQAALTGHLVLSTLHTSDTVATVVRLVDLGVEPWIIANALTVVIAQRLVRTICRACAHLVPLEADMLDGDEIVLEAGTKVPRAKGCFTCHHTGYVGRTGIFEVLEIDDELRDLIKRKAQASEFRAALGRRKVTSLRRDGFEKVRAGITTVDEVIRVTM
jgi:general secretion pathway protein E/type IV pilus assembly protein PilB